MFTGIVTDLGRVRAVLPGGDTGYDIETHYDTGTLAIGASIACAGVCLTAIERGQGWFRVQASAETRARSTLANWRVGTPVNLERSLKLGDELGGHMVAGHVDGVGRLMSLREDGESVRLVFEAPAALGPGIASKGSIAVDGVSLTVNEVTGARFGVNIIPHTRAVTSLGSLKVGDPVNLELDLIARYVARLMGRDLA
ncbi:MAG TPA: riboflavin synthase [Stellaceae bacterium]|jgi:riboflavin synthase|nr:riboflavin synthase [Stellaceae bacterium]